MDTRRKLFIQKDPYDTSRSREWFLGAVRENVAFQLGHCQEYAKLADAQGFCINELNSEKDLYKIPVLPTLYFKRNRLFSMPEIELKLKATSS